MNQTTGSFWEDFRKSFDSQGDALNSGCTDKNSELIRDINISRTIKRWRVALDSFRPELIDENYNVSFFPKFSRPVDYNRSFGDPTLLKFKTRERLRSSIVEELGFSNLLINNKISRIEGSVGRSNYKALFVPGMSNWTADFKIVNPEFCGSDTFIDVERLINESLLSRDFIYEMYDKRNDKPYFEYYKIAEAPAQTFYFKRYSVSEDTEDKLLQVLVSSYDRVQSISPYSNSDEVILHMLRRHYLLDIPSEKKNRQPLVDLYVELMNEQDVGIKRNISSLRYNGDPEKQLFNIHMYSQMNKLENLNNPLKLRLVVNPKLRFWNTNSPFCSGFNCDFFRVKFVGKDTMQMSDRKSVV